MFSKAAMAQDAAGAALSQPSFIESLFPIVLIMIVFWFLIIRPQSKRMKEHRELVASVTKGDIVVTAGGLVGKVVKARDGETEMTVEIADGVRVTVVKSTISDVRRAGATAPATPAKEEKTEK